jgi:hypothetical protein
VTAAVSALIEETLGSSAMPLTVHQIAERLDVPANEIAEIVWGAPESFSWQPGGRWSIATPKATVQPPRSTPGDDDARLAVLSPQEGVELGAIRLSGGGTLRVVRRPLDTAAVFTVKASGGDLQLVLNASHEVFAKLPMPFEDVDGDYKRLLELLLASWAIHEAEAPPAAERGLEDARLIWGRRLLELMDSEE